MAEKNPCKVLPPVDELSSSLKGAIPSLNVGVPDAVKKYNIQTAFSAAAENIGKLVGTLVKNFTNISIGKLPELSLSDLDPTKLITNITDKTFNALSDFNNIDGLLKGGSSALRSKLASQVDCVDIESIGSNELASMQGNLLQNVSIDSIKLSPKDLRDFSIPGTSTMDDYINAQTDKIIAKEKLQAEKGLSNIEVTASHKNALDSLSIELT